MCAASELGVYPIKTAAELTGVPSTTLRYWEKTYSVVLPWRSPGGQRLYSEQDIQRIKWLKRKIEAEGLRAATAHDLLRREIERAGTIDPDAAAPKPLAHEVQTEARSARASQTLANITGILLSALTVDDVLARLVGEASEAAGADKCLFIRIRGDDYTVTETRNVRPGVIGVKRGPLDYPGFALAAAARKPVLIEDAWNDSRTNKDFVVPYELRAFQLLPLITGGEVAGVLALAYDEPRTFDDEDRTTAARMSDAMSAALTSARLFEAESRRAERMSLLKELADIGTASLGEAETARRQVAVLANGLRPKVIIVLAVDSEGRHLRPLALEGFTEDVIVRSFGPVEVDGEGASAKVFRSQEPSFIEDIESDPELSEPARTFNRSIGVRSGASLPLITTGVRVGTLALGWSEPRTFDVEEISFLESVSSEVAAGLRSARLIEAERKAQVRVQQELETTGFLLEAAKVLPASLDVRELLTRVAELTLKFTGLERAFVNLVDTDRRLVTPIVATRDLVLPTGSTIPFDQLSETSLTAILGKRTALLDYELPETPEGDRVIAKANDCRLALFVPLTVRGQVIAHITVDEPGQRYQFSDREIALAEGIASQAAVVLENTRLFEAESEARRQAQSELDRTTLLQELATLATSSLSLPEIGRDVLELTHRRLGLVAATIYSLDGMGGVLRALALLGFPDDVAADMQVVPIDDKSTTGRVVYRGLPIITHESNLLSTPGAMRLRSAVGASTTRWVVLPLKYRERTLGVIGLTFDGERRFEEDELSLYRSIAELLGSAFETARLFESEQAARIREVDRSNRLAVLKEIAELGSSSLDTLQLSQSFADTVPEVFDADRTLVSMSVGSPPQLTPVGNHGWSDELLAELTPIPERSPIMEAFLSCEVRLIEDTTAPENSRQTRSRGKRFGMRAVAVVPLVAGDKPIGALSVAWADPRGFTAEEREFLESIGAEMAIGLQNAYLFEAAQRDASLGGTLARAAELLATSLEIEDVMSDVLSISTEALGAAGGALILREGGGWRTAATHGYSTSASGQFHSDEESPTLMRLLETCEPVTVADINKAPPAARATAERIGYRSLIAFPVLYRGQVTGGLCFLYAEPDRLLSDAERFFVARLAFMAGVTGENTRLYQSEHRIAETLQAALLAMPETMPGVDFAHAYHSATEATRVGGDFYDLFELDPDRVGVIIGDVAGKGLTAAVLTSLVKNTIRAHAAEQGKSPGRILELTNEVVHKATPPEAFVTVVFGVLDRRDGRFVYSNAGHTAGAIARADRKVVPLKQTGPLLGGFSAVSFGEANARLSKGDLVFLYTDGLTEARGEGGMYGEEKLFELLRAERADGLSRTLVWDVVGDVIAYSEGRLRDDMAILAFGLGDAE